MRTVSSEGKRTGKSNMGLVKHMVKTLEYMGVKFLLLMVESKA